LRERLGEWDSGFHALPQSDKPAWHFCFGNHSQYPLTKNNQCRVWPVRDNSEPVPTASGLGLIIMGIIVATGAIGLWARRKRLKAA
jgi:hypothetical protein